MYEQTIVRILSKYGFTVKDNKYLLKDNKFTGIIESCVVIIAEKIISARPNSLLGRELKAAEDEFLSKPFAWNAESLISI